jgi:hypothetical protein
MTVAASVPSSTGAHPGRFAAHADFLGLYRSSGMRGATTSTVTALRALRDSAAQQSQKSINYFDD